MLRSRRDFLTSSAAYAAGLAGLRLAVHSGGVRAETAAAERVGFGPLVDDPEGVLDLPEGFSYRVISRAGEEMADGLLLPGLPDGMAALPGPDGLTLLMRNHELAPTTDQSAFGPAAERIGRVNQAKLYDLGDGSLPGAGGVTTLVYDTQRQEVVRQFLSLGGTTNNCAGGPTPWGSWITCEETTDSPTRTDKSGYSCLRDHGYPFDVPATADPTLHQAEPLKSMGRFRREAVAIDPESGIVYQTEDMDDGAFYRFVPKEPGNLPAGGRLQALAIRDRPSLDTRNWAEQSVPLGERLDVEWIDLDDPQAPNDDLRYRAFDAGGVRFARGEGIWWTGEAACFACTSGGHAELGQIWKYTPPSTGNAGDGRGTLELFVEPNDSNLVHNADNLTASPWGDLVVCEDREGDVVRLIGVTPDGGLYTLANNRLGSELAGVCFSPDGTTLFVNAQHNGLTLAVTGPWGGRG